MPRTAPHTDPNGCPATGSASFAAASRYMLQAHTTGVSAGGVVSSRFDGLDAGDQHPATTESSSRILRPRAVLPRPRPRPRSVGASTSAGDAIYRRVLEMLDREDLPADPPAPSLTPDAAGDHLPARVDGVSSLSCRSRPRHHAPHRFASAAPDSHEPAVVSTGWLAPNRGVANCETTAATKALTAVRVATGAGVALAAGPGGTAEVH